MKYETMKQGRFIARPNRFIAHVEVDGEVEVCHVKNTGRCRELLPPDAVVYVQQSDNPNRKTKFDLISVEKETPKGKLMVNMDSQAPNKVFAEWANAGNFVKDLTLLKGEKTWGKSRFDFYWESQTGEKGFVEVKGVTLEDDGHVRFPDAPTERGVKHVEELVACMEEGYQAAICFVVQMEGMTDFSPNDETHPAFGDALRKAQKAGVTILALGCKVEMDSLQIHQPIEVKL